MAGLPAAWGADQVTRSFLFGVSPTSPGVFLLAAGVLAAAARLAMRLPVHRASLIDPMEVLRV